ncbi:circularly permuted type 2 ATP-grasp protein [Azospirillum picis]|uniref:Circularly permuted ATP-grasp superfamily protein/putative alpha-E superfamily protein n=1 Tax=Azospirillum picis TaxID=488438 RepID=A0ABU0MG64_9PROT|nr:circularly permuted type 2 ATP-grasp protein [Azospirillum picis]MBP2298516.1 putative circularly permuted ATP-grasp superfamily protein/putative alpha-E superfamily protein [Azospirillum picis]MDQ0532435.1 putative circularly permuted ATP-grasp superfamily protein/putative alpha-E superfamily protein [Azospirillum picis]
MPFTQGSLFGEADAIGYGSGQVYDEMVTGQGRLRPHWQTFMSTLGPLDAEQMAHRWEEARRLLHQNGVTYNIYGDPNGMERPWPLDMMPLLLPWHEWKAIESGLIQRASLLNAILTDLYGPQTLTRYGRLPPSVIHADPGFRRAVHGIRVPNDVHLHFYAVDLARAPDGRWWVLSDRTQAPSGSGYALENRAVMAKVLPDSFRHCQVERLTGFFDTFKETLLSLAARNSAGGRTPRVVLLTPGPYNETYFEHVYLARYLGITLVEGGDLTVRDRTVFLKTLSGLEQVDVILRRLDADFADPLEMRADSSLGVAGLIEAVRAGNVVVANALGSGLMESMAMKSSLPTLCRHLLGEELRLPGVASWWCGNDAERAYVLDHLDGLVIKPAFPSLAFEPIFGAQLSAGERSSLVERIKRRPWYFVGQEQLALSTAPVWQDGRLQPRPLVLRTFLCATPSGGYAVMPGGLTRVSSESGRLVVSMQSGGGSKDTWILAARRSDVASTQPRPALATEPTASGARPSANDLPSRVADGLFWLGRYAERAEGTLRLLRATQNRLIDSNMPGAAAQLRPLLDLLFSFGMIPADMARAGEGGPNRGLREALNAAVTDPEHPNSLRSQVLRLHRTAYSVRDRLSMDMWRVVSAIDRQTQQPKARTDSASLALLLDEVMISLAAFSGLEQESMTRGAGWRFLDIGRRIERALHMIAVTRGVRIADLDRLDEPAQAATLSILLELGESIMTYRARHLTRVQRTAVLELLLAEEANPRALAFQLGALDRHMRALPDQGVGTGTDPTGGALAIIATARDSLARGEALADSAMLRVLLDTLAMSLPDVSNFLAHAYFSHAFARSA